jgi:hypothetical protein
MRRQGRKIATLSLLSSVRRSLLAFLKEEKPTLASLLKLRYRRKLGLVTSLLVSLPLSPSSPTLRVRASVSQREAKATSLSSFHYPLPTFADRH